MIKSMGFAVRRPGMSVEQFQAYWRDQHGSLAARVPGLRRYIQCHVVPEAYEAEDPPPYDGVAQLWFDDLAAYQAARESEEWRAIAADARNFLGDGGASMLVIEHPIRDELSYSRERTGMIKRMGFLVRREGMSPADFQHHWKEIHAPMVLEGLDQMRRYVQSHPLLDLYGTEREPAFDGIAETWWDSHETDQLAAAARGETRRTHATDDLANFAAAVRLRALVTQEVVIADSDDGGEAPAADL